MKDTSERMHPGGLVVFRLQPGWWRGPAGKDIWRINRVNSNKIVEMNSQVEKKLAKLPVTPGVYFHKNSTGEILYIGKAANLRNRVRQYFQKSRIRDPKTDALLAEVADLDWKELETEADALFLEAELVRRYQPRFNIMLRDDKSLLYIRIDYKSDYPTVATVRRPLDDGATYFGPYLNGFAIKKALRYLRRAFPYAISKPVNQKRASLHYHLGLDPGLEDGQTSLADYRKNLRRLMQYLRGERTALTNQIEREMKTAASERDFEKAMVLRNQLFALRSLARQSLFGDREVMAASRDEALVELAELLSLKKAPSRIEGFDISHIQGTDNVASMVVFVNGLPYKTSYRKFRMRLLGNDDFGHMKEVITRRFRAENQKKWGLGDLLLIDGGKGQLQAAINARDMAGISIPTIGLAKREEKLIVHRTKSIPGVDSAAVLESAKEMNAFVSESDDYLVIHLPDRMHLVKLLQRIRDESHRFAISYHSTLRKNRQTASLLDEIPGIGPITRKKLIRAFGSTRGVFEADSQQISAVVGKQTGERLSNLLSTYSQSRRPT